MQVVERVGGGGVCVCVEWKEQKVKIKLYKLKREYVCSIRVVNNCKCLRSYVLVCVCVCVQFKEQQQNYILYENHFLF